MSARKHKAARRAERAELGISKQAQREIEEFEALVRAKRAEIAAVAEQPIVSRATRQRALAWFALALLAAFMLAVASGRF